MYEGGIKTPMIANWPSKIKVGSKTNHISAFWDILPTVAEVANCKIPTNVDGVSMLPTLLAKGKQKKHDHLYWEFHAMNGKQAVRKGNWKAVKLNVLTKSKSVSELYDLEKDPSETTDIAKQFPEKVKELEKLMDQNHIESTVFPFYSAIK
jgi:arylsulfatase A-like enzyme